MFGIKRWRKKKNKPQSSGDSSGMRLCDQINNNNHKNPHVEHQIKPEGSWYEIPEGLRGKR